MKRLALLPALFFVASCSGAPVDLHDAEAPSGVGAVDTATVASGGANLVVHVGGRSFVILEDEVTEGLGQGAPSLLANENDMLTVTRAIDASHAPASVLAAKSRSVTVVADSGTRCEASVSDVVLFAQVVPSWEPETHEHLGAKELASEAFELGERGAHFALALDLPRERCTGAHFALTSGDAETARPMPVNEAAAETAIVAFRALPPAAEYDARYVEYLEGRNEADDKANGLVRGTSWDTIMGQAPSVHRFVIGDESLLFVTAGSDEGCGGFNAQMSALFRETPEGPVVVRTWEDFSREPVAIVAAPTGYDVIFDAVKARTSDTVPVNAEPMVFGCRC